jgi:hypothetical protein
LFFVVAAAQPLVSMTARGAVAIVLNNGTRQH